MPRRPEITVGDELHELADVDDERSRHGRRVDPVGAVLDLETRFLRLDHEQREDAGVLVGAHALPLVTVAARVAHELDECRRPVEGVVEPVLRRAKGTRPGAQQRHTDDRASLRPVGQGGAQGRQRVRPEVGALQPVVCRAAGHEVALGADVDLLAPVDAALGELTTGARVAAEVRAARHLDVELVGLGQGEEALGLGEEVLHDVLGDAVTDEVEEPDLMGGPEQRLVKGRHVRPIAR